MSLRRASCRGCGKWLDLGGVSPTGRTCGNCGTPYSSSFSGDAAHEARVSAFLAKAKKVRKPGKHCRACSRPWNAPRAGQGQRCCSACGALLPPKKLKKKKPRRVKETRDGLTPEQRAHLDSIARGNF